MSNKVIRFCIDDNFKKGYNYLEQMCLNQTKIRFPGGDKGYIVALNNSRFDWVDVDDIESYRDTLDEQLLNKGRSRGFEIFYYPKSNQAKFCNF